MIEKDKLIKCLSEMGMDVYETASDVDGETAIQLLNFAEFCRFVQKHKIETIFYHYSYATAEAFQIDDEIIEKLNIDDEILKVVKHEFDCYNQRLNDIDFNKPYCLSLYCIYQNFVFFIEENDYWFNGLGVKMPETVALELIDKYFEDIIEAKEAAKGRRAEQREVLRERILSDENFHKCSNQQLRRAYANKLFDGNDELQGLFCSKEHGLYDVSILTFIEEIWREYKLSR